jgi:hypothetical protein
MRLFDPDVQPKPIRPKQPRARSAWFRPGACPALARRLPGACPALAPRLPGACPALARRLPGACPALARRERALALR